MQRRSASSPGIYFAQSCSRPASMDFWLFLPQNIYLSDYLEIGRTQSTVPPLDELRRMAFYDLDLAVYHAARNTVGFLSGLLQSPISDPRHNLCIQNRIHNPIPVQ